MSITDVFRSGHSGMKSSKYKRLADSLQWRQAFQKAEYYEILLESAKLLRFRQVDNGELKGLGTGAFVWPAAHVLSKYIEKRYIHQMKGMRVCDIGSGTGATGLVAAALGANVTLTDQECILFLLEENKTLFCEEFSELLNLNPADIHICKYDWGEIPNDFDLTFDLILVSDCVLPKLYPIELLVEVSHAPCAENISSIPNRLLLR